MKRTLFAWILASCLLAAGNAAAQGPEETTPIGPGPIPADHPQELTMQRAGSTTIDLRSLPSTPPRMRARQEREAPPFNPVELPGAPTGPQIPSVPPERNAPAPAPIITFEGLDRLNWGSGSPPDTTGDVGPTYYIQSVNSSVGIYDKTTGAQVTAFTYDTLMSQGNFGNQCDNENFGDPIILYDTFEDRWVLTDFAFTLDVGGNVNPPIAFQCFAVSKTGDPVAGGWNFYSITITDFLNDYPKLGVWTDGIYMSANMFGFAATGTFQTTRVWAFNKAQMYAGEPAVQVVSFNQGGDFTLLPANARLQAGTPPPGTPNYYVSTWNFLNALSVYKFHVDWNNVSLSTFTGPDVPLAATSWPNANVANAPQPGTATLLDVLQLRAMMQNQYTNFSGVESLWTTHTVRRGNTTGFAAPRWYQVNVSGGTVAANLPQAATWDPDGANVIHRFMPSLALDRAGNLALGYSTSHSTAGNFPSIKYAGRLAGDPINTFSQTEQVMLTGTASQTGSTRWGDYSTMTLDPDGCTFWYTNQYANPVSQAANQRWLTRIGSFKYAECTPVGNGGTVSGTVTATIGGAPISGATVALGSRTTTTNGSGFYSFTGIPAGTYPSITASAPGYNSSTATSIVVTDAATTTQNFSLDTAPTSGCPTDTTQADFQAGVPTNVDLTTSPGDVILLNAANLDQQNTAGTTTGTGFGTPNWTGQTFIPAMTGQLVQAEIQLFCNGCGATPPNLTLSIRATSGGLPTGADLATTTIPGSLFASGATTTAIGTFGSPATVTSGTQYALVLRPVAVPAGTGYFWIRSSPSTYANGQRVLSADSGGTWTADATRDFNFRTFIQTGFAASGNLVSSLKDSNPAVGSVTDWTTLSWTASVPANTTLSFQVAASNSHTGPFNFVGPDGTAGTFFTTSGASLSQFFGRRYLKYKAYLSTTDSAVTPTLNDVTVCYTVGTPPDLSITKSDGGASVAPGGTVAYTLTYANTGTYGATGVVLTDTVPANTTFNAGASTAGWSCTPDNNAGSTCTLAIGAVAGSSGSLMATFAVTVVNPVATGVTQISNTASIADDGTHTADPTPANNTASDTTPVDAAPDLSVGKSDSGASVSPGGTVSYTLTYANNGNQGATGVTITETVPANTTFNAGASTAGWSCTPDNNAGSTCTFGVGALTAGSGNQTTTFAVDVISPLPAGVTQISNTASIADDGNNGTDPTPADNSGSDTTPVTAAPDLSITKSDGDATAKPGETVSYTLTYANTGSIGATGVEITETVPANSTFNAGASTAGWSCTPDDNAGSTCTLTIGALAAGSGDQTATFAVTVDNPFPAGVYEISNTASIDDDGANGTDPTPGDNSSTDTTPVLGLDYYTVDPCRLLDSRISGGPLTAGAERQITAAGVCSIPSDAVAIAVNVTVVNAANNGHLLIYPIAGAPPTTSVLNFQAGQVRANNAIVSLALDGTFQAAYSLTGGGTADLLVDVVGYFK